MAVSFTLSLSSKIGWLFVFLASNTRDMIPRYLIFCARDVSFFDVTFSFVLHFDFWVIGLEAGTEAYITHV